MGRIASITLPNMKSSIIHFMLRGTHPSVMPRILSQSRKMDLLVSLTSSLLETRQNGLIMQLNERVVLLDLQMPMDLPKPNAVFTLTVPKRLGTVIYGKLINLRLKRLNRLMML